MSYKVEVHAVGDPAGHFVSSALRFETEAESICSGDELASRWFSIDAHRVAESTDAVNYRFDYESGRNVRLEEA